MSQGTTVKTFIQKRENAEFYEKYEKDNWLLSIVVGEKKYELIEYSTLQKEKDFVTRCYGGYTLEEVMNSGKDILAEDLLKQGEPTYSKVEKYLPKITRGAFAFLGGVLSQSGVTVMAENGNVYPQRTEMNKEPQPIFSPSQFTATLFGREPALYLLDGKLPVLFCVFNGEGTITEFAYFVEPGDTDKDPLVWIRVKEYNEKSLEKVSLKYIIVSNSRSPMIRTISEKAFLDALYNTVAYWLRFLECGAQFDIPEKEIERIVYGTQVSFATTFTGDRPHYGHRIYGAEIHDNFPPNYIWSIELCCAFGRTARARRIFENMMEYAISYDGNFCYRQGEDELLGASAGDYGQLLFLISRYRKQLGVENWDEVIWERLVSMGKILLNACQATEEWNNRTLVYMCAEADTNTRVHAYLNNNFWAIRGFESLADLLSAFGKNAVARQFADMAKMLVRNVSELIEENCVIDLRYGNLPPFRFGYTATPSTLSMCRDTFLPMSQEDFEQYLQASYMREQGGNDDLTENSFANYRYYPEILSAMFLEDNQASAIMKFRENTGGEILGMTRFLERLDDWPVLHYAVYLLEKGYIDKYLMLLYAHACHHGRADLMCYYEQVTANGEVFLDDCIPSLLTVPIMTARMFVCEKIKDRTLVLLSGVPKSWLTKGCSVVGVGTSFGKVSVAVKDRCITVEFEEPLAKQAELVWRLKETLKEKDIIEGMEAVEKIEGNRIILKKGITCAKLEIGNNA